MNRIFRNLLNNKKWYQTSAKIFLLIILAQIIIEGIFSLLSYFFSTDFLYFSENKIYSFNILTKYLVGVILGPLLETFIFQKILLSILKRFSTNEIKNSLIGAILFSATHFFSVPYLIKTFIVGYILNFSFLNLQKTHKISYYPFLIIYVAHALTNLFAFIIQ